MGVYLTWLADVLRGAGLTVIEEPGWQSRGFAASTSPGGAMVDLTGGLVHHTGGSPKAKGDYPLRHYITYVGRPDAPPPLAQLGLGRSGAWYVLAAGRANHSGAVDDARYANPRCVGVEAEHPGLTYSWPEDQYDSYVTGCAAIGLYGGIGWRGHKEAAIPAGRKPDPNFDMHRFRADVAAEMARLRGRGIAVQNALNAAGYAVTVDGIVGPQTVAATRTAQGELGLVVDGYPGPVTLAALAAAVSRPGGGIGGGTSPVIVPPTTTEEDTMPTIEEIRNVVREEIAASWAGGVTVSGGTDRQWSTTRDIALGLAAEVGAANTASGPRRVDDLIAEIHAAVVSEEVPDA